MGNTFAAQGASRRPTASQAGSPATAPSADALCAKADQNGDQALSLNELSSMLAEADTRAKVGASSSTSTSGSSQGAAQESRARSGLAQ
jgi:hypothetical protein